MSISNAFGENNTFLLFQRHLDMKNKNIINLAEPQNEHEGATKGFVETQISILISQIQQLENRIAELENKSVSVETKLDTALE